MQSNNYPNPYTCCFNRIHVKKGSSLVGLFDATISTVVCVSLFWLTQNLHLILIIHMITKFGSTLMLCLGLYLKFALFLILNLITLFADIIAITVLFGYSVYMISINSDFGFYWFTCILSLFVGSLKVWFLFIIYKCSGYILDGQQSIDADDTTERHVQSVCQSIALDSMQISHEYTGSPPRYSTVNFLTNNNSVSDERDSSKHLNGSTSSPPNYEEAINVLSKTDEALLK